MQQNNELIIGAGGVRKPGEFFTRAIRRKGTREGYKGLESGFSCGLGTDCALPGQRRENYIDNGGFVAGGLKTGNNGMGGAYTGNLGPASFSGNLASDLANAANADPKKTKIARDAQDVTGKSDLRIKGEMRAIGGNMIANARDGRMENFNRQKLDLSALEIKKEEGFAPKGSITDYSREGFKRMPKMNEQYMKKVSGKGVSLRAQYGL